MKTKRLALISTLAGGALLLLPIMGLCQVPVSQNRIPAQVVINGQMVNAVSVVAANGSVQAYSCLNPQQYASVDGPSQGWACYDASSGVWLLHAVPPAQAQAPQAQVPQIQAPQVQTPQVQAPVQAPQIQQPTVVYPQQPTVVYAQPAPQVVYQQPPAVVYQQPTVVYQPPPTVVYQAPPTVVYQTAPAVIYQQPPTTVVYTEPIRERPVVLAPAYPSSVVLGRAAIDAAGRIASAAIIAHDRVRYVVPEYRDERDHRGHSRDWRR